VPGCDASLDGLTNAAPPCAMGVDGRPRGSASLRRLRGNDSCTEPVGRGGGHGDSPGTGSASPAGATPDVALCAATPTKLVDPADFLGPGQPPPINSGISAAMDVADTGNVVFYVVHYGNQTATIMRVSSAGGPASLVATVFYQVTGAGGDGGSTSQILRIAPDGGTPVVFAQLDGPLPSVWFVADQENLYFSDELGTERAPLAGGPSSPRTGDLGVAGSNLVIADTSGGNVFSVPVGGGPTTILARAQRSPSNPTACGDDVCWMLGSTAPPTGADSLQQVNASGMPVGMPIPNCGPLDEDCRVGGIVRLHAGARPVTLFASRDMQWVVEVVFDGSDFFVSQGGDVSGGWIGKISGAGGPPVTVENADTDSPWAKIAFTGLTRSVAYSALQRAHFRRHSRLRPPLRKAA
jgi:hypothetical protein